MAVLTIETSRPYDVIIGGKILKQIGAVVKEKFPRAKVAVISDDIVHSLYGKTVRDSLIEQGFTVNAWAFPHGEESKNSATLTAIWEFLAAHQFTRSDVIIALGGGVVGDVTGFAAATYLRGIAYIQIPTTFLAAIDSSVGGKTAINLQAGKNLAGAFYQPSLVYCDYETMKTLPPERFSDGTAEAIKYGVLRDEGLFNILAQGEIWQNMAEIIMTCLAIKRDLVIADEFDTGSRQLLNLGHTIGHAIEQESAFAITHGHAVAIGMALISQVAEARGLCPTGTAGLIGQALQTNDLPTASPYAMAKLLSTIKLDKKRQGDTINFILPQKIGQCFLYPVAIDELNNFLTINGG